MSAVAISPNGSYVLTGSDDHSVRLWKIGSEAGGPRPIVLSGHEGPIRNASFNSDGTIAMSLSDDSARLWDGRDGRSIGAPRHGKKMHAATFSVDGRRIATAADDGTVRIWESFSGREIKSIPVSGEPLCLAFNDQGDRLLVGTRQSECKCFDVDGGRQIGASLKGHDDAIVSVAFMPNGSRVITASRDSTVRLWDPVHGEEMHVIKDAKNPYYRVWVTPDSRRIFELTETGTVFTWDSEPERRDSPALGGLR